MEETKSKFYETTNLIVNDFSVNVQTFCLYVAFSFKDWLRLPIYANNLSCGHQ